MGPKWLKKGTFLLILQPSTVSMSKLLKSLHYIDQLIKVSVQFSTEKTQSGDGNWQCKIFCRPAYFQL
jgi:hypothetical protein